MKIKIIISLISWTLIVAEQPQAIWLELPVHHSSNRLNTKEPTVIVLHYSEEALAKTIAIFTAQNTRVSSHYTIDENGNLYQHVTEEKAAHHAGNSYWDGKEDLNNFSIGVEHVNRGFRHTLDEPTGLQITGTDKEWYPFDNAQIEASIELCKYLIEKYQLDPHNIVGHSDVAPGRKVDPGPLFPWQQLAEHGIGAWPSDRAPILTCLKRAQQTNDLTNWLLQHLHLWGYKLPDEKTSAQDIIQAFQMHFRQQNIGGIADEESCIILNNLLQKYIVFGTGCCPCQQQ